MDPLNNQNQVASGNQMPQAEPERTPIGPMAGAVIVIILLVAGGLYFYGATLKKDVANEMPYIPGDEYMMPEGTMPVGELNSDASAGLPPQSSSDDTSSIEADFNAMNMQQMESQNSAELKNI